MRKWRLALALGAGLFLAGPLACPLIELAAVPSGFRVWTEVGRIAELGATSLQLAGAAILFCVPPGILLAVLCQRTDMAGRGIIQRMLLPWIFVPLPIVATSWQAVLGTGGLLPVAAWGGLGQDGILVWQRWTMGSVPAALVHALALFPWVFILVSLGLRCVERELEEDALLSTNAWGVLRYVTLPRCRLALLAAAVWVCVQVLGEITVTDVLEVRTYAEEVYYQFVAGGKDALARGVAVSLPWILLLAMVLGWTLRRVEDRLPLLDSWSDEPLVFSLGWWRWPIGVVVVSLITLALVLPIVGLAWKAGLQGAPECFHFARLTRQLQYAAQYHGDTIVRSLLAAALTGLLTTGWALLHCWLSRDSQWVRRATFVLVVLAWAVPGPVLGIGMKHGINFLMAVEETAWGRGGPLRQALYDGPSLVPIIAIQFVRYFPFAVALLWPIVRQIPQALFESLRVDGGDAYAEGTQIILPLTRVAALCAALAVGVLSLSELSASKLAATPGSHTFAHDLFNKMHYGVTGDLAALCLVLLSIALAGAIVLQAMARLGLAAARQDASNPSLFPIRQPGNPPDLSLPPRDGSP